MALLAATLFAGCAEEKNDWIPIDFDDSGEEERPKKKKKKRKKRRATETETTKTTRASVNESHARAIERSDKRHLRERAHTIHGKLVRALPTSERQAVKKIPFVIDDKRGSVNAFAACLKDGRALVAVSDGLMQVQSQLARAAATDRVFGTKKLDAYLAQLSRSRNLLPPHGFISAKQERDPRKRALQAKLLDDGLAFVIGHELAHHRLHHTGCVGHDSDHVTSADLGRLLSRKAPFFNQPNELASDVYGTENALRAGYHEEGALLMLRFFRARTQLSLGDALVFGFERTHPHPDVRIPTVEQTAKTWRLTGGRSLPKLPNLIL